MFCSRAMRKWSSSRNRKNARFVPLKTRSKTWKSSIVIILLLRFLGAKMAKTQIGMRAQRKLSKRAERSHLGAWQTEQRGYSDHEITVCAGKGRSQGADHSILEPHLKAREENGRFGSKIAVLIWKDKEIRRMSGRQTKSSLNLAAIARQDQYAVKFTLIWLLYERKNISLSFLPIHLALILEGLVILLNFSHLRIDLFLSVQKLLNLFSFTIFVEDDLKSVFGDWVISEKSFPVIRPIFRGWK